MGERNRDQGAPYLPTKTRVPRNQQQELLHRSAYSLFFGKSLFLVVVPVLFFSSVGCNEKSPVACYQNQGLLDAQGVKKNHRRPAGAAPEESGKIQLPRGQGRPFLPATAMVCSRGNEVVLFFVLHPDTESKVWAEMKICSGWCVVLFVQFPPPSGDPDSTAMESPRLLRGIVVARHVRSQGLSPFN